MNSRGAAQVRSIMPKLGPQHYKSYSWRQPLDTHFHRVTCAEFRCKAYVFGWVTTVDTATEIGQAQYHYLTHDRSRSFREEKSGTSLVSFTYAPGNQYFAGDPKHEHVRPNGRPPVMLVHGGDFRGNPRGERARIMRPEDWTDDFATHLDRLARAQK